MSATSSSPASREGASLPVFYARPQALNPLVHARTGLRPRIDYEFARKAHAIPIVASEMPSAMRSYPIVFVGPNHAPVIITGLRPNQNLFVTSDGRWVEPHYIPGYVRRFPFIMSEDSRKPGQLTLCIDLASDRVVDLDATSGKGRDKGQPLFEEGKPSEVTKEALAFCERFQRDSLATRAMIEAIKRHGLFVARNGKIKLENGETLALSDFQVVDEAALNALSDEAFLDLRRSGALALIYCHLASSNSWASLVHQAKRH